MQIMSTQEFAEQTARNESDINHGKSPKGKPNTYYPEGYQDQEQFLMEMRQRFSDSVTADYFNITAMMQDSAFAAGEQWDPVVQADRLFNNKPTLTINTAPAIVGQVLGNRLMNETAINVIPDTGGSKPVANVRKGLIRSIQKQSQAQHAYNTALKNCVIGGLGWFRVTLEYSSNDVFTQDIVIGAIDNPAAVIQDRQATDPTGRDAKYTFIQDLMTIDQFRAAWPWASPGEIGANLAYTQMLQQQGWVTVDMIRVVSYWRLCSEKRTIAMFKDGKIVDVTEQPMPEWMDKVYVNPQTGEPMVRESMRTYAEMCLCSATDVLEGPYRLWLDRIPVFRVPGWEIQVGDTRHRFGLLRFAKDPMRLRNYWRSIVAEKLMQTPKAVWTATKEAVQGHEEAWRQSNTTNDPLLIWNGEAGQAPQRVPPAQMEGALVEQAMMASQDIKDTTNIHEANLGQTSNEVSGKAINARQRIGELGTVIYQYNLNLAIEEAGRVINDLIPYVYDTPRTIKTLGEDGKADLVRINDPEDDKSIDITTGKYLITVTTGPSYETRRMEAVETMKELFGDAPEAYGVAADLFVENMDIPGAEQIAGRLRKNLPPQFQDPETMTDEEKQAAAQKADMDKEAADMQKASAEADIEYKRAQSMQLMATAREAEARAAKIMAEIEKTDAATHKTMIDAKSTEVHDAIDIAQAEKDLSETVEETTEDD